MGGGLSSMSSFLFSSLLKPHSGGKRPGQALIENLCMKAVNQSIGDDAIFTRTEMNVNVFQPMPFRPTPPLAPGRRQYLCP